MVTTRWALIGGSKPPLTGIGPEPAPTDAPQRRFFDYAGPLLQRRDLPGCEDFAAQRGGQVQSAAARSIAAARSPQDLRSSELGDSPKATASLQGVRRSGSSNIWAPASSRPCAGYG